MPKKIKRNPTRELAWLMKNTAKRTTDKFNMIEQYHSVLTLKQRKPSKADQSNPARMEEIRLYNLQLQSEKVAARKALKLLGTPIVNIKDDSVKSVTSNTWRPDGQKPVRGSQKRSKPTDRIPGGFKRRNMLAG